MEGDEVCVPRGDADGAVLREVREPHGEEDRVVRPLYRLEGDLGGNSMGFVVWKGHKTTLRCRLKRKHAYKLVQPGQNSLLMAVQGAIQLWDEVTRHPVVRRNEEIGIVTRGQWPYRPVATRGIMSIDSMTYVLMSSSPLIIQISKIKQEGTKFSRNLLLRLIFTTH